MNSPYYLNSITVRYMRYAHVIVCAKSPAELPDCQVVSAECQLESA